MLKFLGAMLASTFWQNVTSTYSALGTVLEGAGIKASGFYEQLYQKWYT